jgi:hypothetical protein
MLALIFRAGEGLLNGVSTRATLELLWLGDVRRTKGAGRCDTTGAWHVPS